MDAISLLELQHKKAKKALKRPQKQYDADVLETLANELVAHMIIEERIFHPTVIEAKRDLVLESYEEHACTELVLKRLLSTDPDDERFEARASALYDLIEPHVDEEEDELFPKVRKALDAKTLRLLGEHMKAEFDYHVAQGYQRTLPRSPASVTSNAASTKLVHAHV